MVEQRTENPRVGGSNPPLGTIRERLMFKKIFLLTAIALICSSCESPTTITSRGLDSENEKEKAIMQGIALETYYNRVEKLNNIAWPILSSSLDFCKENITDTIGIEVISLNEIDKNYRNAASEKIGLTNEPQILYVVESSPADISGLKKKDKIIKISSPEYSWEGDDIIKNTRKRIFGKNKVRSPQTKSLETQSFSNGVYKVLVADIAISFDNVIGVVGAAKGNYYLMVIGLLLSVFLIATLASYFADFIRRHKWLGYLGLFVILIIALQLIIGGLVNYEVLSINEKFKFLFAI